jgi:hypothetical protein
MVLLTGLACLGGIGFLVYCQARFGRWDVYMLLQQAEWHIYPNYLAAFDPRSYVRFIWMIGEEGEWNVNGVSATVLPVALIIGAVIAWLEVRAYRRHAGQTGWRERLPYYFCGLVSFYISMSGTASVYFKSMLRYSLITHVVFVLALVHLAITVAPQATRDYRPGRVVVFGLMNAAMFALVLMWRYAGGWWVA